MISSSGELRRLWPRCSTITLTMDRYVHVALMGLTATLHKLPALPSTDAAKATGTDSVVAGTVGGLVANSCDGLRPADPTEAPEGDPEAGKNP